MRLVPINKLLCITLMCGLMAGGCHYVNPRMNASSFPATQSASPITQAVRLQLAESFRTYQHSFSRALDPWHYQLGASLDAYARRLASKHFQYVEVDEQASTEASGTATLLLTPTVRKVDVTKFATIFDRQVVTIDVEWTLTRPGDASPIWNATFEGSAEGDAGTEKPVRSAMLDLWEKSDAGFSKLHNLSIFRR